VIYKCSAIDKIQYLSFFDLYDHDIKIDIPVSRLEVSTYTVNSFNQDRGLFGKLKFSFTWPDGERKVFEESFRFKYQPIFDLDDTGFGCMLR